MAIITKYYPFEFVMDAVLRNTGYKDLSEGDVISWINEAMGFMDAVSVLEARVAFGEVVDNRITLPKGLKFIRKVAKHKSYDPKWKHEKVCGLGDAFVRDTSDCNYPNPAILKEAGCCEKIELDCNGCPINLAGTIYYRPFWDVKYLYDKLVQNDYYRTNYTPISLGNHAFHNSLVCKDDQLYPVGCDTYTPYGKRELLFNFEEGNVAISYYRHPLDENGNPMIPALQSYVTAIIKYVTFVKSCIEYNLDSVDPSKYRKKIDSERDWHWYCGQANNDAFLPNSEDEYERIYTDRDALLPKSSYFSYFGIN